MDVRARFDDVFIPSQHSEFFAIFSQIVNFLVFAFIPILWNLCLGTLCIELFFVYVPTC
jgi:hypothetical protein